MPNSAHRRVPRAYVDSIVSARDALAVFRMQMSHPRVDETLVMFLDDDFLGGMLITVGGTVAQSAVVEVAEKMAIVASSAMSCTGLVLASVRARGGPLPGDGDIWTAACEAVESHDLDLIDWLVIGARYAASPRRQMGLASRWPCGP